MHHNLRGFSRTRALVLIVAFALIAATAVAVNILRQPDTYKGFPKFDAAAHHCTVPKQTKKISLWTCVSDERNSNSLPAPGAQKVSHQVIPLDTVSSSDGVSPGDPPPYSVPTSEPTDGGADTNDPSISDADSVSASDTPSNLGATTNAPIPAGSTDGEITPSSVCAPGGALYAQPKVGITPPGCPNTLPGGGGSAAVQYHCQAHAGCWYRPRTNSTYFDSNTGYYGIYSPNGSYYEVGRDYYYIAWALSGTHNRTMHEDGWINFYSASAGNDSVGFSGAMQNGGPGHSSGGSQIGGSVCSAAVHHTKAPGQTGPAVKASAPGTPFCTKSNTGSHDHNMVQEFEWVSADSNVPDDVYWYCYTRSPVAYSSDGGSTKTFGFHSLASAYHGLTSTSSNNHCTAVGGELSLG